MPSPNEPDASEIAHLRLLRRLMALQAGMVVGCALIVVLVLGITVYFNARLSVLEQRLADGPPVAGNAGPAAPAPLQTKALAPPTPMSVAAATPTRVPASQSQPAGRQGADAELAGVLKTISAMVRPNDAGQSTLSDPVRARQLAEQLELLLSSNASADPPGIAELYLAHVWLALGEHARGHKWAVASAAKAPNDVPPLLVQADALQLLRQTPDAIAAAEKAVKIGNGESKDTARLALASLLSRTGRKDQALAVLAEVVAPSPLLANAAKLQCQLLMDMQKYAQAADAARQAIGAGANAEAMNVLLGEALIRANEPSKALAVLGPMLAVVNERSPRPLLLYGGIAQLKTGDMPAAIATFDKLIAMCAANPPEWNLAYHWRGVASLQGNDLPGARENLLKAVALEPNYAPSWEKLGVAKLNGGDLPAAVESLRQAVGLPDCDATAPVVLALVLVRQNQVEPARQVLLDAARRDPAVLEKAKQVPQLSGVLPVLASQPR